MKSLLKTILFFATISLTSGLLHASNPFTAYLVDETGDFMRALAQSTREQEGKVCVPKLESKGSVNELDYYTFSRAYSSECPDMDSDEEYQLVVFTQRGYSNSVESVELSQDSKTWYSDNQQLTLRKKQIPVQMHGLLSTMNLSSADPTNPKQVIEFLGGIARQSYLLGLMDHPHVVRPVFEAEATTSFPLFEKPGTNYRDIIEGQKQTPADVLPYLIQAAEALTYLHSQDIAHGDIKLESLFIKDRRLVLGNFERFSLVTKASGSQDLGRKKFTFYNNPFHAPELRYPQGSKLTWRYTHATTEGDVWSFGMMLASALYMTAEGHRTAADSLIAQPLWKIMNLPTEPAKESPLAASPLEKYYRKSTVSFEPAFAKTRKSAAALDKLQQLINDCTQLNPYKRPTAEAVFETLKTIQKDL